MKDHPYQKRIDSLREDPFITKIGEKKYRLNFSHPQMPTGGYFSCPDCGSLINPTDETKKSYIVLEPKVDRGGELVEIVLMCNECGSEITMYDLNPKKRRNN